MKIKHTHPVYGTPEERRQALLDAKQLCAAALLTRKETAARRNA